MQLNWPSLAKQLLSRERYGVCSQRKGTNISEGEELFSLQQKGIQKIDEAQRKQDRAQARPVPLRVFSGNVVILFMSRYSPSRPDDDTFFNLIFITTLRGRCVDSFLFIYLFMFADEEIEAQGG